MRVLFVCVGNTCRSQMAEGWAKHLGLEASSAGTSMMSGSLVATNAVIAMAEKGIDISHQQPSLVDDVDHTSFDKVFSMGCGVSCPNIPLDGDWELDDPVNKSLDDYRDTRDAIEAHVRGLIE
jgi:arsenate reductase|tara:strand:- start:311 stop:679 length:369 start_codon:yes stop_codon:yes gene_type:complete